MISIAVLLLADIIFTYTRTIGIDLREPCLTSGGW